MKQKTESRMLRSLSLLSAACTMAVLLFLILYILARGLPHLKPELFAWQYSSENVSLTPALVNTLRMLFLALLFSVPMGVGAAIYLAEYAGKGSRLVGLIRLTTETLSGIPSIIYGLFGYLFFVRQLGFGYSLLGGAMTLAIMVLPLILRQTEEALCAVPVLFREGSFGLGAGKLRTIFAIVLPAAAPGILVGVILSIGRIVGETAALIYTAGTVAGIPESVMGSGRTLSVHMYALTNEGLYTSQAYATAVVLLVLVAGINGVSSFLAARLSRKGTEKGKR